ncbi:MAG TPA: hypothetical protein EYP55_05660 [Anaerolineae bacterium]|nr:hypothetical protein [Anaerolineae bacterium]
MRLRDRLIFGFLTLLDWLLGGDLTERELSRREARVAQQEARLRVLEERLAEMEERLSRAKMVVEAEDLWLCFAYARQRLARDPRGELRLDSSDPMEDKAADFLIEHMVKPGFATVRMEEGPEGRHIYYIKPAWQKIYDHLEGIGIHVEGEAGLAD